jgi:hypothetical protein
MIQHRAVDFALIDVDRQTDIDPASDRMTNAANAKHHASSLLQQLDYLDAFTVGLWKLR